MAIVEGQEPEELDQDPVSQTVMKTRRRNTRIPPMIIEELTEVAHSQTRGEVLGNELMEPVAPMLENRENQLNHYPYLIEKAGSSITKRIAEV
ncbi:hypothetical protein TB2_004500 [Malus domestica]